MRLNAPTVPVFLTSVVLVIAVVATKYFGTNIPGAEPLIQGQLFEILLVAYGILVLSNLLRRF